MMLRRRFFVLRSNAVLSNEIWYTTSDNTVLTASSNSAFSTGLVSNTYVGGKGVLRYSTPLTTLPLNMFRGCTKLTSVTIPASITTWGNYTFHSTGLTSIEVPEGVTTIGNEVFAGCASLTKVTFPNSVTKIGTYTFLNCTALQSVQLPQPLQTISNYMFRGCTRLTKIEIPSNVTSIGVYAFYSCSQLERITIPDNVTSIGESAFEVTTTTDLTEVTIGSNVTSIGQNAFKNQTKLTTIYCNSSTPPTIQSNTFEGVPSSCVVRVPNSAVSAYRSASYWNNFTIQGSSTTLISFTIETTEYQAVEGMTWGKWVESEYNTDGYSVEEMDNSIASPSSDDFLISSWVGTDTDYVYASDVIENGYNYILVG